MTLHYGLRGEVESKCAKKLETLNPSFSSIKSNLYLLHFFIRLWPIFGTQKMGLNWCKNLSKIAAIVWATVLSKILPIQSLRTDNSKPRLNSNMWNPFNTYKYQNVIPFKLIDKKKAGNIRLSNNCVFSRRLDIFRIQPTKTQPGKDKIKKEENWYIALEGQMVK